MKPFDLHFLERPGVRIKGTLYESLDADVLLQDLLEMEMPGGKTIDVGWYPEHDPNGRFRVRLYQDNDQDYLMRAFADTPSEALEFVRVFVESAYPDKESVSSVHELEIQEQRELNMDEWQYA